MPLSTVIKCARTLHCRPEHLLAPIGDPIPPRPPFWPRIRRQLAAEFYTVRVISEIICRARTGRSGKHGTESPDLGNATIV
jgi:hypothetical protein